MKNITKQVVILDNFTSPYIHQAILILKDYNPSLEGKIIEEAENIVGQYLNTGRYIPPEKHKKKVPLWIFATVFAVLSAFLICYYL